MSPNDESDNPDLDRLMRFDGPDEFPPPSALVEAEFGAYSERGKSRAVNEDHYLVVRLGRHQETLLSSLADASAVERFDEYGYAMILADGMEGGGGGELASRLALLTLLHLVRRFGKWNLRVDARIAREMMARAERFYRRVDTTLIERTQESEGAILRTTLTATFGAGRDLFLAHVGHSRAYLYRNGILMRLTRDHTIGRNHQTKVPTAPLVDVNVGGRDLQHILTDAIGMGGTVGPLIDLERIQLYDRDTVLVCTNGLTDMVDEEVIGEVLGSPHTPIELSRTLVELAMAMGGDDDVTALVAQYRIPGEVPPV